MEMLILGLAVGGAAGVGSRKLARKRDAKEPEGANGATSPRSRRMVKSAAKGYLALAGAAGAVGATARGWTSGIRSDFRDALEEARQKRDNDAAPQPPA
jgi:hypothetical protein